MSDMLSQKEIDTLLKGTDNVDTNEGSSEFTEEEKDAIGEVGNISMGTAATTLSTLLGQKVNITTPKVEILSIDEISEKYPLPFVAVDVRYKEGLEGTNLLILKDKDVKIITDLMMGGNGSAAEGQISDMHLSAIGEAMNQMVGSSSTSLSDMLNKKIDIDPPDTFILQLSTDNLLNHFSSYENKLIKISFRMEIGELIDSEIMQLMPIQFAKEIVEQLFNDVSGIASNSINAELEEILSKSDSYNLSETEAIKKPNSASNSNSIHSKKNDINEDKKVNISPVQFQSFDESSTKNEIPENISLIQDVPLKVTVELGRTVKKISEILEFSPGTIIELDKLVGEPLDILVNGQYVAKGEVVVIDENYGVRVTDIVSPAKRISKV